MKNVIVLLLFFLIFGGCVNSTQKTFPMETELPKKNETIQIDITSEVEKFEKLFADVINEVLEECSPDTLLKKTSSCTKAQIKSKIDNRFNAFANEIKMLKPPYNEYVRRNLGRDLYKTYALKSDFFTSKLKHKLLNFDFKPLHLENRINKIMTEPKLAIEPVISDGPTKNGLTLDITYNFDHKNLFGKVKTERVAKDRFHIIFDTTDNFIKLTIQFIGNESVHCIQNINEMGELVKRILLKDEYIRLEAKFRFDGRIWSFKQDLPEEIKAIEQKIKVLSNIEDESLYCRLLAMNFKLFELQKDVSIKEISTIYYKNKSYLNIKLIHLNILNNVNIKLNDSYKISRYLYDKIVRKGIRTFSNVLTGDSLSGISFDILSSEKNFVGDDNDDIVRYQFFMPETEALQYINDDITGRALANASYILVDGERIEIR